MPLTRSACIYLSVFLLVLLFACTPQKEDAIVTFKDGSLNQEDLEAHFQRLRRSKRFSKNPEQVTREFAYAHAVNMEMIIAKALDEKLHQDPRVRTELHELMSDLFLRIMQERLVEPIDRESLRDEEIRAYFDAHPENYQTPSKYAVSIIEHPDKKMLEGLRNQIQAGKITFAQAATNFSTDNATNIHGGATGTRPLDKYRQDWRTNIAPLAVGEMSPPVPIKDTFVLFLLTKKIEAIPHDFEQRKAYVKNDLLYDRYRQAWEQVYTDLKKEYKLEVNESKLQDFLTKEDNRARG